MDVITETFCECGENHAGMEKVGEMAAEGDGFTLEDLQQAAEFAISVFGCSCRIIDLGDGIRDVVGDAVPVEAVRPAYVLVIRGLTTGVEEFKQLLDVKWDTKYFDTRRKKVLNKHARSNNIVGYFEQEADYENGKGTVVHFDRVPALKALLEERLHMLGERFKKLILAEGNRYGDGGAKKNGIGFHGDAERRLVVAMRCSAVEGAPSMPMKFQWYYKNSPVGEMASIELQTGDVYVMSEVAVGTDWRHSSWLTLRHATGADKYVTIRPKKRKREEVAAEEAVVA